MSKADSKSAGSWLRHDKRLIDRLAATYLLEIRAQTPANPTDYNAYRKPINQQCELSDYKIALAKFIENA